MHPRDLQIQDFTYSLPDHRIAWYPLKKRDDSKLLIYKEGQIREDHYANISQHLPENALLVFNNTKVVEARLLFKKPTGGSIEVFCLEPHARYSDIATAMLQQGKVWWNCLVGGAGKWKHGSILEKRITTDTGELVLNAGIVERQADSFTIELSWQPATLSFAEVLHFAGLIPLPPYIKRTAGETDKERYQTIYAKHDGSVAAPTAGLHFTDEIFQSLTEKNITTGFVTLHVGAGTFKPVKASRMEDHSMHTEFIEVTEELITQLIDNTGSIFSVGTTSMRTLESLYWMGVKIVQNNDIQVDKLAVTQWEVYDLLPQHTGVVESLKALQEWMKEKQLNKLISQTQILIAPGYQPKIISGLITNFHQPQSTLLLLVAALIGNEWKRVYSYALENDFRFLSYGDGCLLFK